MNIQLFSILILLFSSTLQVDIKGSMSQLQYLSENHQIKAGQLYVNEIVQAKVQADLADILVTVKSMNTSQSDAQAQLKKQAQQMITTFKDRKIVYNIAKRSHKCTKYQQNFTCVSVYVLSLNRVNTQRINKVMGVISKLNVKALSIKYGMSDRRKYQYRNAILQIASRRSYVQAERISKLIGKPIKGIKSARYYDYLKLTQTMKIDQQKQFLNRNTMTYRVQLYVAYFLDNK